MTAQLSRLALALAVVASAAVLMTGCNGQEPISVAASPTTMGMELDDTVVTTRVKSVLLEDQDIKGLDVYKRQRQHNQGTCGNATGQNGRQRATGPLRLQGRQRESGIGHGAQIAHQTLSRPQQARPTARPLRGFLLSVI